MTGPYWKSYSLIVALKRLITVERRGGAQIMLTTKKGVLLDG
jgi:hypothetical protein